MKKLDFMVIGAQKSGTTALARFLGEHPDIGMAQPKEAHAFDHETYAEQWTDARLDEYYGGFFSHIAEEAVLGEATPIYLFLPDVPEQLRSWQPELKLVVILRDPVQRAWSHYRMEVASGYEHLPFWLALLVEPLRLRLGAKPLAAHSALRENSYRARGCYAKQLARYLRYFPREQLLVLRSDDLVSKHEQTLARVFAFLGVKPATGIVEESVNAQEPRPVPALSCMLLRMSYWWDLWRLKSLVNFPVKDWVLGK